MRIWEIYAFVLKFAIWENFSGFVEHVYSPPSGDIAGDGDRIFCDRGYFYNESQNI